MTPYQPLQPNSAVRDRSPFAWLSLCAALAVLLLLAACGPKPSAPSSMLPPPPLSLEERLAKADMAWRDGDHERAELLYGEVLRTQSLSVDHRVLILQRYVRSALLSQRYNDALQGLKDWADLRPEAKNTQEWQGLHAQALGGAGQQQAGGMSTQPEGQAQDGGMVIESNLTDAATPLPVRIEAAKRYAEAKFKEGAYFDGLNALRILYSQLASTQEKSDLETWLAEALKRIPRNDLASLAESAASGNFLDFPAAVVRFAQARALAATSPEAWPAAWKELRELATRGQFAEPEMVRATLAALERQQGVPHIGVALALPLSGRFAALGSKVVDGANVAVGQLEASGLPIELRVINTDEPGWKESIEQLPPHFQFIGGALQPDVFKAMREAGITSRRAVFAFRQSLGDAVEGQDAWRFFGSPEDQIKALLTLAGELGIQRFGVLAPSDAYGEGMSRIFDRQTSEHGFDVVRHAAYTPGDYTKWTKSVAQVIGANAGANPKDEPIPDPGFQALFLPDNWAAAQILVPQIFFYEGSHLLLMGTEIWSEALMSPGNKDVSYFGLAVCPSPLALGQDENAHMELADGLRAAGRPEPDSWSTLGFDFLRFAVRMGKLPDGWSARDVNERLPYAQSMEFSQAPITWNDRGQASQQLQILQPAPTGLAPVERAMLAQQLEDAARKRADRFANQKQRRDEERAARAVQTAP